MPIVESGEHERFQYRLSPFGFLKLMLAACLVGLVLGSGIGVALAYTR